MKAFFSIGACFLLCSCVAAPTVKQTTTPNGKQGFYISCDGAADDWTSCYDAANKSCKGAYNVIDKSESSTPTQYGPLVRRSFLVECK